MASPSSAAVVVPATASVATFAAGCFWGTERYFKKQFGRPAASGPVYAISVGYMQGALRDGAGALLTASPGYKSICSGTTGCAEVMQVAFDAQKLTFDDLCYFFFRMHNPTTKNRQNNDIGTQYRSAIMVHTPEQERVAHRVIQELSTGKPTEGTPSTVDVAQIRNQHLKAFGGEPIATSVEPATAYFSAEDYHQQYLDVNPNGYCSHRLYY